MSSTHNEETVFPRSHDCFRDMHTVKSRVVFTSPLTTANIFFWAPRNPVHCPLKIPTRPPATCILGAVQPNPEDVCSRDGAHKEFD